jgi:hypothetical protein
MATGDNLLEAVTADTIAHEGARAAKHSLAIGTPCPNCRTAIAGPWCYACGQRAEKFNRSIWRLAGEAFEALVELDGRVWQTFPRLIIRPGRLTRDYLDGHRAVQVPPFRIFLIVLLLVFFAASIDVSRGHRNFRLVPPNSPEAANIMSPEIQKRMNVQVGDAKASAWLKERLLFSLNHQDAFFRSVAEWSQRFAFLMLPIAALILTVLFVFKKGVYVFDHLIFTMHSLSFQGLLLSAVFLLGAFGQDWGGWVLMASPVHLFVHMRGTYGISTFGTLIRMGLLFFGSSIAFGLLIGGLVVVGLATAH